MSSYLYTTYSYACSFVWTPAKSSVQAPAKMDPYPAEVTLKQNQAVYQELFSRLMAINSLLYRKDYSAFTERWTHLKNYEGVWTTDMRNHLDPLFDGQFFNIWFNPAYTFPIHVLQSKIEGCIAVTAELASFTEAQKKQIYSDLYSDLMQMEVYLNFGDYQTFQEYARVLEGYQSVWTPEMTACLDPMEDQSRRMKDVAGVRALQQNLSSCMKIVEERSH